MTSKKNNLSGEIKGISKDRFSLVFDSIRDAIFILDVEDSDTYRFAYVNQQFLDNMEMTRDEVVGASLEAVIPKESVSFVKTKYRQAIQVEDNMAWEESVELDSGTKTGIVKVTPIINDDGHCTQLIGSITDITDRKNAEEALQNVMDQSLDVICTIDDKGHFIKVSQASKAIWGYEPDELEGEPFMNFVHPDDRQLTREMAERIMSGLDVTNFENRYVRKDGDTVHMIWSARGDQGDQIMYCIAKDATAIKEAERQINLRERRFRNLVHEGVDMISILSDEARFIYASPSHETLLGYETEELIGINAIENLIHPDDRHEILEAFKSLDTKKRVKTNTYRVRKKNGEYIRLESTGTNMKDDPAVGGIIVNSLDVTESFYYNSLDKLEREILEQNISGVELPDLLTNYLRGIESLHDGVKGSILKVENGKVYNLASPSLPKPLVDAINGESISGNAGSCGTAAFKGEKVIVKDARTDEKWERYRQIVKDYDIISCWSYPIFNSKKEVIATFAVYHPGNRAPNSLEENTLERAAQLLRVIFKNQRILGSLRISNERYEHVSRATSDAIWDYEPATGNLFWGEGFNTLFGYDRAESKKGISRWIENIHPEDKGDIETLVQKMLKGSTSRWDQEYRFKNADGSYSYVRDKAIVVRDDEGNPERVIGAMEDITRRKEEEEQLKLMESVVTNTRDSVLITRAEEMDEPNGPEIIFVNEAFEHMTGYSAHEVIGKTPRILQGPNTDFDKLDELGKQIRRWEPATVETINYKKNGEEFWISFSVTPVANETGGYSHWIAVQRDVTERKNQELKRFLISEIGNIFNETEGTNAAIEKTLTTLKNFADFELVEFWKPSHDHKHINLAIALQDGIKEFYNIDGGKNYYKSGQGLPGITWTSGKPQFWKNLQKRKTFIRRRSAKEAGLKTGYGFPVKHNGDVVGVLVFAVKETPEKPQYFASILEEVAQHLGNEIQRKELEEELSRIFSSAPDGIIVAGFDGYFKKVNPAMIEHLGYSEEELLANPVLDFVHPDDKQKTVEEFEALNKGKGSHYFENRYVTKSGKIIWLSWTTKAFYDEGITYSVAKNVTEQKELEELLKQANKLAKIGSWEVDLIDNSIYWSDMTRQIHEESPGFEPDLLAGLNYYKKGESRERINTAIKEAIRQGTPFDLELPIITAKGNEKWIRTIGKPELVDGNCIGIYGSFQDIHEKKQLENRLKNISNNIPGVLFQYQMLPDESDQLLYLSKRSIELWGVSPEKAMENNQLVWSRFNVEDLKDVKASIKESGESLTRWQSSWRYHHPDGSIRWQEGYGTPHKNPDGSVTWDSIVFDITEKKRLEELLAQTAKLAKVGSWELDLRENENEMYWSDMTRQILEVNEDYNPTLTGGFEFYTPGSKEQIQNAVEKAIETGEQFDEELLLITSTGKERWVRCIGQAETINGETKRIFGSFQDIHDRKSAEVKLKRRSRHIEAISQLKSALLNYKNWYSALEENLKVIGEAVEADRVYYFENHTNPESEERLTSQKLEWTRGDVEPQIDNSDLQNIPFKAIPEVLGAMMYSEPTTALRSELPQDSKLRQLLEDQDVKAFLAFPVIVNGDFYGFVGFDNCTVERYWTDDEIEAIDTITASLSTAIEREISDQELQAAYTERNRILESISDAFYAVDKNWNITYFNSEAEKLLKRTSEELIGNRFWDEFAAAVDTELYEAYHHVMEKQEPSSFEYYYPPQESWYDISAYPAGDGISVYFKNIDEQKKVRQQILNKTRQLDAIAMFNGLLIKSGHWKDALQKSLETIGKVVDADRVYFFNNRYSDQLGENTASISCEWVDERTTESFDHPANQEIPFSELDEFLERLTNNIPYKNIVEDISDSTFREVLKQQNVESILAIPIFVGDRFYGAIGFDDCSIKREWSDEEISFLKTIAINLASAIENEDAENALQEAYEEKTEILESIGDAFFAVDDEWTVTYWNNVAEEKLGMPRDKILGENLWELYEDATSLEFYSQYHKAVNEQVTVQFEEYYPAVEKWFEVSAYPSSGRLSIFFRDITDRKESEKRLKELNESLTNQAKELAKSNAELEQFAFVASHDLQEPLRMITGFLAQLEKKYKDELDEKGKKYIYFATDGAKRMRQIILDLLDFSRVGRVETEHEIVNLNGLMKDVLSLNRNLINDKKAKITVDDLPEISASRSSIRQLFLNLVNNALKYHSRGTTPVVTVSCEEKEKRWVFSVKDNGIGINPEYSDKIFNIFQRLHGREDYSGTGMGLAICKKIVEEHGGEIWVESKEGEGSIFYFTIPKNE